MGLAGANGFDGDAGLYGGRFDSASSLKGLAGFDILIGSDGSTSFSTIVTGLFGLAGCHGGKFESASSLIGLAGANGLDGDTGLYGGRFVSASSLKGLAGLFNELGFDGDKF